MPPHPSQLPQLLPANSDDPRILHAQALKATKVDRSVFNNLITLYSKSNFPSHSLRLFHQIAHPNVVSWTSLISACSNTLLALHHFVYMLRHPTFPNQRTLASLFKTCASLSCLPFGLSLHCLSFKLSLSDEPFAGSALINFYSKFRLPDEAKKVFDEIPQKDNVCYSALITGLAQNSRCVDSLSVFAEMRSCDVASSMYSISSALRAAAELAALEQCKIIHAHAVVTAFDSYVVVGSALIDGYSKAGMVQDARRMFDSNLSDMNIVGWNALMAGYAQQGDHDSTLELFNLMEAQGFVPDEYSFLAVLTSLYNSGMFLQSEHWLTRMKLEYGLEPTLEHYTCLVGVMGRAGQLDKAERIALTMPFKPDAAVWRALLSACAIHGAADKAWSMATRVLELQPHDDTAYVILANVLSAAERWDDVAKVRWMMKDRRVKKKGGRSWIEVQGKVHVFVAGEWKHERSVEIYHKLAELMEEITKLGYVPVWDEMLHNVGEELKKEALWYHSEKLAVAFGVLSGSAPHGKPLRIVKNLRICKDCHEAFKYMTRVLEREIIVRDVNRYHRFFDGKCACGDMW
ncbi:pentatricopeptide repeat-containing protein [Senna tora]|uniref:Pentatricopeptide repeat-containing protein n=1 Tax=Senna tora TaxID=362788 RepID=A0A834WQ31_9FABA|nr:pentatricopeptide repeat-containing protein [Senna tora]